MDDYHNSNQNQPESSDNSWQSDNSQPQNNDQNNNQNNNQNNDQNNDQNNNQNDYQNNYQNNYQYEAPQRETNRLAVASMIVGIFAMLTCCIPFIQFPLAVVTIVLVILSKKGKPFNGFAVAGLVLGILAVIISIGMTIYWGVLISLMKDPEFMSIYNSLLESYH